MLAADWYTSGEWEDGREGGSPKLSCQDPTGQSSMEGGKIKHQLSIRVQRVLHNYIIKPSMLRPVAECISSNFAACVIGSNNVTCE